MLDSPAVAWLAKLDAKAKRWPRPAYWAYVGVKWYLIAAGAIVLTLYTLERMGVPIPH